ncbi:helix-turn-helix domain-containing protein [Pseudoflavonifractor sp. BIOML-A6]|nr:MULTISPECIES: helix-turn-helix transcriptional regulator [unclassified Pseudoflavonifractor]MTQ97539.1 helix-turn-helix domain-containing protein [Pseudoflavonifractor sp. BIOML-A16]MTR06498.1 helix-turn-helix domain-containing protein [Pseudoflavonifractor sp. BIOML-A15]MTR31879.1 helix-turn-helix domain-containing protein [Pseudoflavonifractor sp. BIOML-A14]MTR36473.1 helix-turn-helix domain-containing protein [Pseudoflavonifractor sp. BIOML-A9]MTR74645.1 helix-turn-helix domain-containin
MIGADERTGDTMTNFSNNLPILRRRAGYTQEYLAEALEVSRQAVSKWESGATLPEAATLLTLAEVLDCTLDQLMREELADDIPSRAERQAVDEEARFALFVAYDRHMDRYALTVAGGVMLIMFGLGLLISLVGMGSTSGLVVVPLLLCVAAAVFLFIFGGVSHSDFQKAHPVLPEFYAPEAAAGFNRAFRIGMAVSVSAIVADVALLVMLTAIFRHDETMLLFSVALFFFILGAAVGALIFLGMVQSKYNLKKYMENAAIVRQSAGLGAPDEPGMK